MKRGLFVALGFALLLTGTLAETALAGDGSIHVYPSEERHSAEPGEEVKIDVIVSHHGTPFAGVAVGLLALVAAGVTLLLRRF